MRKIELTQGKCALVDDGDYKMLMCKKWHAVNIRSKCELERWAAAFSKNNKKIYMHRIVCSAPKGYVVDHINGNGLDNRRSNLRICKHKMNTRNRGQNNGRLFPKGVSKSNDVFRCRIEVDGKKIELGRYRTVTEAAMVYDEAAKKYFGEFARLNFSDC